MLEEDIRIIV